MMGEIPALVCGVVRTITGDALGHRLGGGVSLSLKAVGKTKALTLHFLAQLCHIVLMMSFMREASLLVWVIVVVLNHFVD